MKNENIKGIIVLNSSFNEYLEKQNFDMLGALNVVSNLHSTGWDVGIVNPEDVYKNTKNEIQFKKVFQYNPAQVNVAEVDPKNYQEGDFLWVRQIGENKTDNEFSEKFCKIIDQAKQNFNYMLNPKGSTKYFLKKEQSKLDLPFPRTFSPQHPQELTDYIEEGYQLIAKPTVGWKSKNLKILKNTEDAKRFIGENESIENYLFQEFLPLEEGKPHELRIAWIGDKYFLREKVYSPNNKGYDSVKNVFMRHPQDITPHQKKALYSAKEQTGMDMGSIDFRNGTHIIELNNAGIGLSRFNPGDYAFKKYLHALEPEVVNFLRGKL